MKYIVNGGNKLFGRVKADLAKNALLPIIAATIMCDEECVIKGIPMYLDVIEMSAILEKLGKKIEIKDGNLITELSQPIRFNIHDRIGGGDAFAGGVIHGLILNFDNPKYAVLYGLNTSVLKHTISGDASIFSCEDIEAFMAANGSAEVVR